MDTTQTLVLAISGVLFTITVAACVGMMLAKHLDKKHAAHASNLP